MNRKILKALVQLFAMVARPDDTQRRGRPLVAGFLSRMLGGEQAEIYLAEFDELMDRQYRGNDNTIVRKRRAASSVRVLRICTEINEELNHSQKCFVLVLLVEFLSADGVLDPQDLDFVRTVGETFHIAAGEIDLVIRFAGPAEETPYAGRWLVVCSSDAAIPAAENVFTVEGMEGVLILMRIESAGTYYLRYSGAGEYYLNGQLLRPGPVYAFPQGSVIRSSRITSLYYSDLAGRFMQQHEQQRISFVARNIEHRFQNGKRGLHKFSFSEESGRLIGIMGASGAGKSTLLNILNGNEKPVSGHVLINGYDLHHASAKTAGLIGFVPQDDLLMEDLTVFQNLWYNAKLCFAGYSDIQLRERVEHTLSELGLTDIRDLKVGSPLNKVISGGQRKRLNIALELIREPAVLFLDEPTSGLSSRDSENCMDLLKELALKGKLIFVVIHQPSSAVFKMFDRLLLLDVGGFPIYYGNPVDSVIYFRSLVDHVKAGESECPECGNVNPEQLFDILESRVVDEQGRPTALRKISPKEWNIFFKRSQPAPAGPEPEPAPLPVSDFRKPSRWAQFRVFFTRDFLSKRSNRQYMVINLLEAPLLALMMGYFLRFSGGETYSYYHNPNVPAYLLICVIASLFFGLTVSAEEIIRDRRIRRREKFLHLSRGSYLLSKTALLFALSAIQSFTFLLVGNTLMGMEGLLVSDWLVLFSVSCFANMLGLNISAAFNSAVTIYILIPILIIPQLLLSGVLVRFDQLHPSMQGAPGTVPGAAGLMVSRWAYEALAVNRFANNAAEKQVFPYNVELSECSYLLNYWLPRMEDKLLRLSDPAFAQQAERERNALHAEVVQVNAGGKFNVFPSPEIILTEPAVSLAGRMQEWLSRIRLLCSRRMEKARMQKDAVIAQQGPGWSQQVERHTNEQLDRLLRKADQFDKIRILADGTLIRDFEPVYQIPAKGRLLSGQFYAPVKRIGNVLLDTIYANVLIIWIMSVLLFFLLYVNGLRWLMKMPSKLSGNSSGG